MTAPVNKIPVEIWENIVELCFDAEDWDIGRNLSQVNRHIRYILLNTPIPWRRLRVCLGRSHNTFSRTFDLTAFEYVRRSGSAVKHLHIDLHDYTPQTIKRIKFIQAAFTFDNTLDTFKLTCKVPLPSCNFVCPPARHVVAHVLGVRDEEDWEEMHDKEGPKLLLNSDLGTLLETVDCKNVLLRQTYDSYLNNLKSISVDCSGGPADTWDYDYMDTVPYDPDQFNVIFSAAKLESLRIVQVDTDEPFRARRMPHLKSLFVKDSFNNYMEHLNSPNLESLIMINCREMKDLEIDCFLKHLHIVSTSLTYQFNIQAVVSLSLESSVWPLDDWLRMPSHRLHSNNCRSLKALNLSFTNLSLERVVEIVNNLQLKQLVCELPNTHKHGNRAALEKAIADKVPHYWTSMEQYRTDIQDSDELEKYFIYQ